MILSLYLVEKCLSCGRVVEMVSWREDYGEVFLGCPFCFGPCREAARCQACGSYFFIDEWDGSVGDLCDKCAECQRI